MKDRIKTVLLLGFFAIFLMGAQESCGFDSGNEQSSAEREQTRATQQLMAEAQSAVGMPRIVNWTERRLMKQILEMRDDPQLSTYTYIVNWQGDLLPLCHSLGYGLPYSVQYTNPQVAVEVDTYGSPDPAVTLPQPDPNGLFMPGGLSATMVLCINPETGQPDPIYVEPEIIVSPFQLDLTGWGNPGG